MCPYLRMISDHLMIVHNSVSKQLLYNYMHPLNRWQTQRWMGWTWQNLCLSLSLSLSLSLPAGWLHKDMHSHLKMHLSTKCSLCSRLLDKLYVCVCDKVIIILKLNLRWKLMIQQSEIKYLSLLIKSNISVQLLGSAICENDTHSKNTVCANVKDRGRFEIFTCLFCSKAKIIHSSIQICNN